MTTFVDQLVKRYLKLKGHENIAKVLQNNNNSGSSNCSQESFPATSSSSRDDDDLFMLCEDIVLDGINDGNYKQMLLETFDTFRAWASDSLDFLKPELLLLCLPVFSYTYLCLIRKKLNSDALTFWNDNVKLSPDLSMFYSKEISELSMLVDADQIFNHEFLHHHTFIKCLIENKYLIKISQFSYNLLKSFALQNDLLYLATILNEKCIFELYDGEETSMVDNKNFPSLHLKGYHSILLNFNVSDRSYVSSMASPSGKRGATTSNQQPQLPYVNLFIPSKTPIDINGLEKAIDEKKQKFNGDVTISELLQKVVRPKLLLSGKRPIQDIQTGKYSSQNKHYYFVNNYWIPRDLNKNSRSTNSEPSILVATITNTYNGMICLDINHQITQAVGGFRDNSVRVFRIGGPYIELTNDEVHKKVSKIGGYYSDLDYHLDHNMNTVYPQEKNAHEQSILAQKNCFKNMSNNLASDASKSADYSSSSSSSAAAAAAGVGVQAADTMTELHGHNKPVFGLSQSINSKMILSASADETVRLWDINLAQTVAKFQCNGVVWDVEFNPIFDCYFSAATNNGSLFVYNTNRSTPIRIMSGHTSDVNCTKWSNNGMIVVSGSDDKTTRIWDFRDGNCVRILTGSTASISCVNVSRDGRLIASGTDIGIIYIYDIYTSKLLGVLTGHKNSVTSVAFNEDTQCLVSSSLDGTIRIWDVNQVLNQFSSATSGVLYTETESQRVNNDTTTDDSSRNKIEPSFVSRHALQPSYSSNKLLNYHSMLPKSVNVIPDKHVFYTKYTPLYYANFTSENLIYCGGPYTVDSIL